jgi:hypothetical protein
MVVGLEELGAGFARRGLALLHRKEAVDHLHSGWHDHREL